MRRRDDALCSLVVVSPARVHVQRKNSFTVDKQETTFPGQPPGMSRHHKPDPSPRLRWHNHTKVAAGVIAVNAVAPSHRVVNHLRLGKNASYSLIERGDRQSGIAITNLARTE